MTTAGLTENRPGIGAMLPDITSGIVNGFIEVIFAVSLTSLIFSGPLAAHLPRGLALALLTVAIHILFTTAQTPFFGVIASIQDNSAVVLALAAASLFATMAGSPAFVPTLFVLIAVTTLLAGVFLILLGHFKLGGLGRYIPYPVTGGFLAGTGWLLARGAIGTMADYPLTASTLPRLLTSEQLLRWLPGVLFGLVLFLGVRRIRHVLVMPVLLLCGLVVFFAVLVLTGTSLDVAAEHGLLLGSMGRAAVWQPILGDLGQTDWNAILGQTGNIAVILALSVITLLLNISGMELIFRREIDLNRELQVAGFANILSGLVGGMIGYHALSLTVLNQRIGARQRTAGIIAGAICLVTLLAGASALTYLPKALIGGLLLFIGLDFLDEWVVKGYKNLGRTDYAVLLLILFLVASFGFLVGVGVGLVLMVIIFVVRYSQINMIRHALSGAEVVSHVERNAHHQRQLHLLGKQIYVLELQGYLFFGTANTLLEQLGSRLNDREEKPLAFLILDFKRVTGMDSSSVFSFAKVNYLAENHHFTVLMTGLTTDTEQDLRRAGLLSNDRMMIFPDLDRGLEWCEDQLLVINAVTQQHIATTLPIQLADLGFEKAYTAQLQHYLEDVEFAPGDYLIHQGADATDLFFIQIGQVSIYLELQDGERMRLRTMSMGTIVGEMGFYLGSRRSASVIADLPTIAFRLSRGKLEIMKTENPELAIVFNELMVRIVSERLAATNLEIAALNR